MLSDSRFGSPFPFFRSLRGRRLKGKGKGVLDARETRGAREEALAFLSRLKLPFPSPPNTCHAGYRRSKGKGKGIRVPDHARGKKITKITQLWMTSWQISLAPMHVVFLALFFFCFPKTRLNFRRLPVRSLILPEERLFRWMSAGSFSRTAAGSRAYPKTRNLK